MAELTEDLLRRLERYGFDPALQRRWQEDVAAGRLSRANNAVSDTLLAPPPDTIRQLPGRRTRAAEKLSALGQKAIAAGQFGVVVLNGGMATRFGGLVKGVVPVLGPSRSFLGLTAEDVLRAQRTSGGRVRLLCMNSFATEETTRQHFEEHQHFGLDPAGIEHFNQFVGLRMTPKGELFRLENGELSPYGPGHGDFPAAIRQAGALQRFVDRGGRYLLVRNVDNLGARIDPLILGHHLQSGSQVTVELAPKWPEDVGGSPFLYRGRTQLVEQLRYPPGFDPNIVPVFNTNTFVFDALALDRDFDLGWYWVEREVEGRRAVQIERLIGELTGFLSTNFLQVRRAGLQSRFLPVKTPDDLQAAREEIEAMYDGEPDAV